MNKTITAILAALLLSLSLGAQEHHPYITAGYGFAPFFQGDRVDTYSSDYSSLGSIYEPLNTKVRLTGAFTVEGGTSLDKHSDIFVMAGFCHAYNASASQTLNDGSTYAFSTNDLKGNAISVMVGWRYTYLKKSVFSLYSSVAVGTGLYLGFTTDKSARNTKFLGEGQLMPVGITLGKKAYWFLETGYGTQYVGGRTGFGYRF